MSSKKLAACAVKPRFALIFQRRENRRFARFSVIFTVSVTAEKLLLFLSLREPEIIQVLREASVGRRYRASLQLDLGEEREIRATGFKFSPLNLFPCTFYLNYLTTILNGPGHWGRKLFTSYHSKGVG